MSEPVPCGASAAGGKPSANWRWGFPPTLLRGGPEALRCGNWRRLYKFRN
jgi:hypothetical protein